MPESLIINSHLLFYFIFSSFYTLKHFVWLVTFYYYKLISANLYHNLLVFPWSFWLLFVYILNSTFLTLIIVGNLIKVIILFSLYSSLVASGTIYGCLSNLLYNLLQEKEKKKFNLLLDITLWLFQEPQIQCVQNWALLIPEYAFFRLYSNSQWTITVTCCSKFAAKSNNSILNYLWTVFYFS